MKLVKLIPISEEAKANVELHGDTYEILLDNGDSFMVRSLQQSFRYREGVMGKWLGTLKKEEATWEEV